MPKRKKQTKRTGIPTPDATSGSQRTEVGLLIENAPLEPAIEFTRPRGCYTRVQRDGLALSLTAVICHNTGGVWEVEHEGRLYIVIPKAGTCTCDAYRQARPQTACKHVWAVYYTIEPPAPDELQAPPELQLLKQTAPIVKPTQDEVRQYSVRDFLGGGYSRHQHAYDQVLRDEFGSTLDLARDIFVQYAGESLWKPPTPTAPDNGAPRGAKSFPLWLMLFANFVRVYNKFSYRGTEGLLKFLINRNYLDDAPEFNTISAFNRDPSTTTIINNLIHVTASPFADIGKLCIAGDGTGFSSGWYGDYRREKREKKEEAREHAWWRSTAICDVDGLFVVAARVTSFEIGEIPSLVEMLTELVRNHGYELDRFLGDLGFDSTELRDQIVNLGLVPLIPLKANRKNPIPPEHKDKVKHPAVLLELFHYVSKDPHFHEEYRMRWKIECLFSSVKARFGTHVHSISESGARNDILASFLGHNIRMLNIARQIFDKKFSIAKVA